MRIRGGVDTGAGKKQRSVKLQEVENRKQEINRRLYSDDGRLRDWFDWFLRVTSII